MDAARRSMIAWMLALAAAAPAAAQSPGRDVLYTRQTLIKIPFTPSTTGRLKQVILYVSTDSGRDWQPCSEAAPTDRYFRDYIAPGDGTYWFAVQSIDTFDSRNPPSLAQLVPEVKVVVDTKPPLVTLRQADDPRPGIVTVQWDVRDDHLDLSRFAVEYKVPGRTDWIRDERALAGITGTLSWNVDPGVQMMVRLRAADRAGNVGEAVLPLTLGGSGGTAGSSAVASSAGIQFVSNRTVAISVRASVGISGTKDFDLWYTRDGGRSWTKAPKKMEGGMPANPADAVATPVNLKLIFEADADGQYGFTVVIRNGVGVGDPDPRPGDPPRFSVVVDTVEPKLQLRVTRGTGADMRNVTIQWIAEDEHLADRPVTLEYAELKGGMPPGESDWKPLPLLPGAQDRSGTHVWTIGRDGPFKFLVRARAVDRAKNTTVQVIPEPVIVDLEQPRVEILGIDPSPPKP